MAVEPLRSDMKEAGQAFLAVLDELGLGVQAASWLYFHGLNDWRFYVATPLVETMGRKRVYGLLADALDVLGTPDGMTVFDLHLEGAEGGLFKMLTALIHIDGGMVEFKNCSFNGVPVDAVFYRMTVATTALKYPKKVAKDFERNVERILARS